MTQPMPNRRSFLQTAVVTTAVVATGEVAGGSMVSSASQPIPEIDINQFVFRLQLHDKQLISTKELMRHVKNDKGEITFPGVVDNNNPKHLIGVAGNLLASQFVLQLGDKQLLTASEIRQFFGFTPERDE